MLKELFQDRYALAVLIGLVYVWIMSSCSTVNLDCSYIQQDNGNLVQYCKVPKDDKPIGRKGN